MPTDRDGHDTPGAPGPEGGAGRPAVRSVYEGTRTWARIDARGRAITSDEGPPADPPAPPGNEPPGGPPDEPFVVG